MENDYINQLKVIQPTRAEHFANLQNFYTKKLWHQLTEGIQETFNFPEFADPETKYLFYVNFIKEFESKLNLLTLSIIVSKIAREFADPQRAISFLEDFSKKVQTKDQQAYIITRIEIANWKLRLSELKETKKILEECKTTIDDLNSVDIAVNSYYYRVYSEYLKVTNAPGEFYKNALLYLAYTPVESMTLLEQKKIAFDLGLAAILGKNIYNFGELLGHPAVDSLQNSEAEWLYKLLHVFNRGDISGYEQLISSYKDKMAAQPDLVRNAVLLKQKIQLMSLIELIFNREVGNRILTFNEISAYSKQPVDSVELLLLKALALGLIRGVINQVDQTIQVTWVQSRVLDRGQIDSVKQKIGSWINKVQNTLTFLETETPELVQN